VNVYLISTIFFNIIFNKYLTYKEHCNRILYNSIIIEFISIKLYYKIIKKLTFVKSISCWDFFFPVLGSVVGIITCCTYNFFSSNAAHRFLKQIQLVLK